MSFVASDLFIATTTGMEQRLAELERRLNELFGKVEERFTSQGSEIQNSGVKLAALISEFQGVSNETTQMPDRMRAVISEQQTFVVEKHRAFDDNMGRIQEMMNQMNNGIATMRGDLNSVKAEVTAGSSRPSSGGGRSLIDPKTFKLTVFDGDKHENKQMWEDWREDMEDYLNQFHPGIKAILEKAARWKSEVTIGEFAAVVGQAGIDPGALTWNFNVVDQEIFTFIRKFLTGRARKAFSSSEVGGFDGYRKLISEMDPINHRTKAAMMDAITSMIKKGSSRNYRELKARLTDLELMVKKYRQRTAESPDHTLLASILSNLLDDKSREAFVNLGILHDFVGMKNRIIHSACHGG